MRVRQEGDTLRNLEAKYRDQSKELNQLQSKLVRATDPKVLDAGKESL